MPAHWPVVTRFYPFLLFTPSWVRILKKIRQYLRFPPLNGSCTWAHCLQKERLCPVWRRSGRETVGVRRSQAPLGRLLTGGLTDQGRGVPDTQTPSPPSPMAWRGISRTRWEAWGSPNTGRPAGTPRGSTGQKPEPVPRGLEDSCPGGLGSQSTHDPHAACSGGAELGVGAYGNLYMLASVRLTRGGRVGGERKCGVHRPSQSRTPTSKLAWVGPPSGLSGAAGCWQGSELELRTSWPLPQALCGSAVTLSLSSVKQAVSSCCFMSVGNFKILIKRHS